ncbi:glycoside hydrolase N-terminal domain-containing protein [Microbacterium sp. 2P01SA-2]|uniref:glycosyl hydrolase family 95 catalytic domain-containing protein n=1 Tax=unclassified Microbacterium TaxID=2609290 RepID=UPI0039A2EF10
MSELPELVFRSTEPADTWEHGLVVGSGRVGAVVHGSGDELRVSLAHERFFLPANPRPPAPLLRSALPRLRAALAKHHDRLAADILDTALAEAGFTDLVWTDPLALCGSLTVRTPGGCASMTREVDLVRGVAGVTWHDESGSAHRVDVVAPRDTDTIELSLEAEADTEMRVRLGIAPTEDTPAASFAPDYTGTVTARSRAGEVGHLEIVDTAARVVATVAAAVPDSAVVWAAVDDALEVRIFVPGGRRRTVRLDLSIAGHPTVPAPPATWTKRLRSQERDHGSLVAASLLDLDGAPGTAATTTGDLWREARSGNAGAVRRAVEIAYVSGRSNVIASTGELPPTLQGVWQGTWRPAWSADYTMNGNVQNGALAGIGATGTPELALSLLALVLPHIDDYRENARRIYGADGMLFPSRMSTHGIANHVDRAYPHVFWAGAGPWILRIAADVLSLTGDRSIVDDRLWDLVEGVLTFGETATVVVDGIRHFSPSYSPENTPSGSATPLAIDAAIDIAAYRDAAAAARLLGLARGDDSLDARWGVLADSLPHLAVAPDGTLAEWLDPAATERIGHRHVSQLYPLWYEPGEAFAADSASAAALRQAARRTIDAKIAWRAHDPAPPPGRMEMAFGLGQLGQAAAALGDADSAAQCVEWLALLHWRPSLMTTHDAGSIFNLDASGALPAVVAAMLTGSTIDTLDLLPALPQRWPRGTITGLRARGGIVIDRLSWDEHAATAELRRLPSASWLRPAGTTTVRLGSDFTWEDEPTHAGGTPRVVRLGDTPITLRMRRRTRTPAGPPTSAS